MVIVSRNLERANENDGFKMTALEFEMLYSTPIKMFTVNTITGRAMFCNPAFFFDRSFQVGGLQNMERMSLYLM